jgi:hypothetical protein
LEIAMRRFWTDRKGNVAILFAFATVPLIGGIGAAVDYSLANAFRTDMQKAVDSTALALSKIMPASDQTLHDVGLKYFLSSMGPHTLQNISLQVFPEVGQVRVRVTGNYPPKIVSILGATTFQVGADSVAKWGIGKIEVALVLDNSGSMADHSRMTHLKAAAHDLRAQSWRCQGRDRSVRFRGARALQSVERARLDQMGHRRQLQHFPGVVDLTVELPCLDRRVDVVELVLYPMGQLVRLRRRPRHRHRQQRRFRYGAGCRHDQRPTRNPVPGQALR